jgi:hypothetical protein
LALTTFSYQETKPYFDFITQQLRGEVPNQIERFNFPHSFSVWENYCITVHEQFLRERSERIIYELNKFLSADEMLIPVAYCYPNPFTSKIYIGVDSDDFCVKEVAIYDMMGRKVFVQPCCLTSGHNEIALCPNLTLGVYVLKLGDLSFMIVNR